MSLVDKLIYEEENLKEFVAPVVSPGYAIIRISGLVKAFKVLPATYEGFGIFKPEGLFALVMRDAEFEEKMEYLERLSYLRMILIKKLRNKSWLSIPFNLSDAKLRFGIKEPKVIHLVEDCLPFDQVITSVDSEVLWFKETDERADFEIAERLRNAGLGELNERGLTPEQFQAFRIAHEIDKKRKAQTMDAKLKRALSVSGAKLVEYEDGRVDDTLDVSWEWEGENHTVTIKKDNFRVVSSGICLEGHDADYSLESIVSVIRDREW